MTPSKTPCPPIGINSLFSSIVLKSSQYFKYLCTSFRKVIVLRKVINVKSNWVSVTMASINDVIKGDFEGKKAQIRGWIYRIRSSGGIVFAVVRDASGIIQVTVKKGNVVNEEFEEASKTLIESSVIIEGRVVKDDRAPGGFEIQATKFEIVGKADVFPITKDKSEEFLLDNRHLWLRSRKLTNVMKVKASVLKAAREWFDKNDFYEMTPPLITTNVCEGGGTVFDLDYFGRKAFLSQSAQMYLEALIYSLDKVWSLTPSFRAEKSRTRRHITEYWHLESEEAWVDNEGNMKTQENLISHICKKVAAEREEELKFLGRDIDDLKKIKPPFKRMSYDDASDFLQKKGYDFEWGDDLGAKEEREMTINEKIPLFIINYPKEVKAFYMKENPDDSRTYLCSDLLAPEGHGEIIGGSERETDYNKLLERLKALKVDLKYYQWYLDLRKYGSVPHSGFGLGIERLVTWICKLDHIRDAIPFPRTITRVYP